MVFQIKNQQVLHKILWLDTFLGGATAFLGLLFSKPLTKLLGLATDLIVTVSVITLVYAMVACTLAVQKPTSIPLLRLLVKANWMWTGISVVLLFIHYDHATNLGIAFLIMQIVAVGGLAYLEGNQIIKIDEPGGSGRPN